MEQKERANTSNLSPIFSHQRRDIYRRSCKLWGEEKAVAIIGEHPSLSAAEQKTAQYAKSDAPVLMTGESGAGKEIFAKSLYLLSTRYGKPFGCVNCAQFHDPNMMVSELFGHKKGSFTL
jgi:transcriptional regulator with PAS, ATPase and Fis domain